MLFINRVFIRKTNKQTNIYIYIIFNNRWLKKKNYLNIYIYKKC